MIVSSDSQGRARVVAWQTVPVPPLPEQWHGVITVTATELWCTVCGSDGAETITVHGDPRRSAPVCWRCGRRTMRLATSVLRAGEFVLR